MNRMIGNKNWNNKTFEITQQGSHNWTGEVVVWRTDTYGAAHGRRVSGSASAQWATGDKIKLRVCSDGGLLSVCRYPNSDLINIKQYI